MGIKSEHRFMGRGQQLENPDRWQDAEQPVTEVSQS